jgi:hypothetical protein
MIGWDELPDEPLPAPKYWGGWVGTVEGDHGDIFVAETEAGPQPLGSESQHGMGMSQAHDRTAEAATRARLESEAASTQALARSLGFRPASIGDVLMRAEMEANAADARAERFRKLHPDGVERQQPMSESEVTAQRLRESRMLSRSESQRRRRVREIASPADERAADYARSFWGAWANFAGTGGRS